MRVPQTVGPEFLDPVGLPKEGVVTGNRIRIVARGNGIDTEDLSVRIGGLNRVDVLREIKRPTRIAAVTDGDVQLAVVGIVHAHGRIETKMPAVMVAKRLLDPHQFSVGIEIDTATRIQGPFADRCPVIQATRGIEHHGVGNGRRRATTTDGGIHFAKARHAHVAKVGVKRQTADSRFAFLVHIAGYNVGE